MPIHQGSVELYMNTDNSHLGSSQEVKSNSSNGCQQTSRVGRNFMVTLGRPLFLTIENDSENSILGGIGEC